MISQRSRGSVCSSSAFSSHRSRSGRSCEGTTTAISGAGAAIGAAMMPDTLRRARMEVGQPDITVVIATRDRATRLQAALASLHGQTLPRDRFEVIVVDDRSTDGTQAVLAAET